MPIEDAGWLEDQQKWLEQHREKQKTSPQLGKLVSDRAESCLREVTNKSIKQPGLFIRELNNVLREIQTIGHGTSERLKHEIVSFLNNFQINARKGNPVLPAEFQRSCILSASEFDRTGNIVSKLCNIFDEKYGEMAEKEKILQQQRYEGVRRHFEAAATLRKLAAILKKL
jgi:hypothetical protein